MSGLAGNVLKLYHPLEVINGGIIAKCPTPGIFRCKTLYLNHTCNFVLSANSNASRQTTSWNDWSIYFITRKILKYGQWFIISHIKAFAQNYSSYLYDFDIVTRFCSYKSHLQQASYPILQLSSHNAPVFSGSFNFSWISLSHYLSPHGFLIRALSFWNLVFPKMQFSNIVWYKIYDGNIVIMPSDLNVTSSTSWCRPAMHYIYFLAVASTSGTNMKLFISSSM